MFSSTKLPFIGVYRENPFCSQSWNPMSGMGWTLNKRFLTICCKVDQQLTSEMSDTQRVKQYKEIRKSIQFMAFKLFYKKIFNWYLKQRRERKPSFMGLQLTCELTQWISPCQFSHDMLSRIDFYLTDEATETQRG